MASTPWDESAVAAHLLRSVLPGNAVLTGVVPRGGGALSAVHEVRQADGPTLVVKRYADQWRWKQEKEVYVLGLLNGSRPFADRIRVPEVVHVDAERAVTVMTLLPGRPLSHVSLDGTAERAVLAEVGALTRALHTIRQPAFGYLTTRVLDPLPTNHAYMARQFDKKLAEFADLGGDSDVHASISGYVSDHAELLERCEQPVLCHNDLHAGNILVEPDGDGWRVTGLVDVENAIAADPLMDLAKTIQYEFERPPDAFDALVEGYGPLGPDGAERIRLYRTYHALELWDWFASIGTTAPLDGIAADLRSLPASNDR
ncbi:phosphotransferase family protein [Myceligenerans pegani]|uniref:Aminoglycoside phosphotransferase family protein n=1 Tax=Myceligenerans pegani TaxID=2776917 RepID=A0ABR9MU39_9MICO|nr:aminoglycoside phosphotransferase family protein [Myceligenerans sp. TRM 65318]MBE1874875.1 aminoglycoside phosphotransferase family protein [Myceligenerans sp. TRM 65318]MBE3017146.1 aminoglycoside phosphotransferase family protein [Myceligenerans sp. TRM 65318]